MKNVKIQVVAALLSLAAALPVKSRAGQWAPSNIPATFANLKTVAAKAAASAPAKAVLADDPSSTKSPYEQLLAQYNDKNTAKPSLDDLKGVHEGKCYGESDGPNAPGYETLIKGDIVQHDPPIAPTQELYYISAAFGSSYEMSLIAHDNDIEACTVQPTQKWRGYSVYITLDFVKVGNALIARSGMFSSPQGVYQTSGFACYFPLSNANQ